MRKSPQQARSAHTVEAVLDAAAQLLDRDGAEAAFSTNRIAARAGFSIGTLYQYFPNKRAILRALADRELRRLEARMREALADPALTSPEHVVAATVRTVLEAFGRRPHVRRFLLVHLVGTEAGPMMVRTMDTLTTLLGEALAARSSIHPDRLTLYVAGRAVSGAIRTALLERSPWFGTPEFERALVRLAAGFLASTNGEQPK